MWIASATCIASSRVGTSTRPHVWRGAGLRFGDALQHRQRERRRLAGAGLGLAEQIAPVEQQRNRLALDRRRLLVSERGDDVGELALEPERGKGGNGGGFHPTIMSHRPARKRRLPPSYRAAG